MQKRINTQWIPLFATNFLGVFNDNFLKVLGCLIAVKWVAHDNEGTLIALASAMLVIPYILFSPLAGRLSKLKNKRDIVRIAKFAEMPIMLLATVGFFTQSVYIIIFGIFLMGVQSALFSPAKYGLIRDVGGDKGLSFGTGTMEMLTFLGIILATLAAGLVSDYYFVNTVVMPLLCFTLFLIALFGWLTSREIKVTESQVDAECDDSINPILFIRDSYRWAKTIPGFNFVVLGLCGFWLIGSVLQILLLSYCQSELGMDGFHTSLVVTCSALGIGTGCYLAGVLSNHTVNLRLTLWGGMGVVVTFLTIYFFPCKGHDWVFSAMIFVTGLFSGLHEVPLNAWVQKHITGRQLGDALAYINITTFIFMSCGAGLYALVDHFWNISYLFIVLASVIAITTFIMYYNISEMRKNKN